MNNTGLLDSEKDYMTTRFSRRACTDAMNEYLSDSRMVQYWNNGSIRALYHSNFDAARVIEQLPNLDTLIVEVDHLESAYLGSIEYIPDDDLTGDYRQNLIEISKHPILKRVYIFFTEDELYSDINLHSIQRGEVGLRRIDGVFGSDVEYYVIYDL